MNEDEYERFREFARERGLSLKEASHEALLEWVERQQQAEWPLYVHGVGLCELGPQLGGDSALPFS